MGPRPASRPLYARIHWCYTSLTLCGVARSVPLTWMALLPLHLCMLPGDVSTCETITEQSYHLGLAGLLTVLSCRAC